MAWDCSNNWGDHQRYRILIFQPSRNLFHRRRCFTRWSRLLQNNGRVDDVVIVSGHNLVPFYWGCHQWASSSCRKCYCWFSAWHQGNALYGYVILKESGEIRNKENLFKEINHISDQCKPIAKLDKIQFFRFHPKHVLVKLCRILRKIAEGDSLTLEILDITKSWNCGRNKR
jgi:acetyl-CoA synthetase